MHNISHCLNWIKEGVKTHFTCHYILCPQPPNLDHELVFMQITLAFSREYIYIKVKGKVIPVWPRGWVEVWLYSSMTAATEGREWSAARLGLPLPPVPILQETGWAPGPVWMGGKFLLHRDSIRHHPYRSQSQYWLSYQAHIYIYILARNTCSPQGYQRNWTQNKYGYHKTHVTWTWHKNKTSINQI